ncbi:hypothetical protein CVD28_02975 [Bacillus sp. M6-12]|uniref:YczE/YyaS/YitT family protein n=1 Tax=Bacillus sp. M6-12 TaxID=2054166 RepID=UPI000C7891AD|nr:hypothetical protein [Bacillus sp. M6-12]PLS19394.1 hypothetical protein CVD28_02975 [Bacillus sp. M6-12]
MKERLLQLVVGHIILTFGISLLVISNVGVGSWDTVYLGLKEHIGGTYGTWSFVIQLSLVLVNSLILWKKPEWKSLIGIALSSALIDFWLGVVFPGVLMEGVVLQAVVFGTGIALLALGIATYIRTNFFNSPFDGLMIATSKRLHVSLQTARTINEFTAVAIGFLLGGPVGVGTIILSLCLGYGIQTSMKWLDSLKNKGLVHA